MKYLKALQRPALMIITLMVLINAGVVGYFYETGKSRDDDIRQAAADARKISEQNRLTLQQLKVERTIRSDQTCELLEGQHKQEVKNLKGTYSYLVQAESAPQEKNTLLYKLIVKGLPETEAKAQIDAAPEYCDAPNIGLPEPDPKIPKRPKALANVPLPPPPEIHANVNHQDLRNP